MCSLYRQGNESDEFWDGLGGYPEEPVKVCMCACYAYIDAPTGTEVPG